MSAPGEMSTTTASHAGASTSRSALILASIAREIVRRDALGRANADSQERAAFARDRRNDSGS